MALGGSNAAVVFVSPCRLQMGQLVKMWVWTLTVSWWWSILLQSKGDGRDALIAGVMRPVSCLVGPIRW